jgi:hypothetical protein
VTSDRKITLHELHAAYASRYAEKHNTTIKAVLEDLIEEHLLPSLLAATEETDPDWGDLQIAANRLIPEGWFIEPSFTAGTTASGGPALFHMINVNTDDVGPIFASSESLRLFAEDLKAVAANGGIVQLDSAFPKLGAASIQVRRRGSALVFRNIENSDEPKATLPTRLVGKLYQALQLAIQSQEKKKTTLMGGDCNA